ncbi:MAG: phospholipase D-like domain-containing protein [Allosphingosinicella sp.]
MLEPGRNCWRIARADRAALIIDAADYFRLARQAMLEARSQILMIGWDFDTRISLDPDAGGDVPEQLGPFVSWLADNRKDLSIHILKWDIGAVKLLGRGSTVFRLARWAADDQIHFKLDGAHPTGASHHQKILVIDDTLAFCGGIDMTADRWDTREHRDRDKRRKRPTTGRLYMPWHDATMAVDGEAARSLGELARNRWAAAGGKPLGPPRAAGTDPWPQALEATFRDVDVAVARTRGAYKDLEAVREIEALYVDMIARAKRFVYAENQFFASRVIARAIARRLAEPDGPQFVLVNPCVVDGWLEEKVMSPARERLMRMLAEHDRYGRFRIYTPVTEGGEDIYVHSKITIVDDETLRVGSANMNNRSMGLDSECDLLIDARLPANAGAGPAIARIRCDLLAEHLGATGEAVETTFAKTGSLIGTIEALRGEGRTLVPFEPEAPNAVEEKIAETEMLDPESAGDDFEPMARPGLFSGAFSSLGSR